MYTFFLQLQCCACTLHRREIVQKHFWFFALQRFLYMHVGSSCPRVYFYILECVPCSALCRCVMWSRQCVFLFCVQQSTKSTTQFPMLCMLRCATGLRHKRGNCALLLLLLAWWTHFFSVMQFRFFFFFLLVCVMQCVELQHEHSCPVTNFM